jgi:hypothetical protein
MAGVETYIKGKVKMPTSKIPKPPKRKSKTEFPDPDFHQQKKDFNKQIRGVILKFSKVIPRSRNRDLLLKFLDCVTPGKSIDVTRLPYAVDRPSAKSENKIECVFAKISWVIQKYWEWCEDGKAILECPLYQGINEDLTKLQQILTNGLNQYQIRGDFANGFYLERR